MIAQLIADMRRNQIMSEQTPSLLDTSEYYGDVPMASPMAREFIGDRVMSSDPNMLNPQLGAPMFTGSGDPRGTVQLNTAGGTMSSEGMKGYAGGGRLGVNLPISDTMNTSIGVTGGGANVKYGMGTPFEGKSDMWKVQGIDAVLRDLARNQEFGAGVSRDIQNNPFYSLYYRKAF